MKKIKLTINSLYDLKPLLRSGEIIALNVDYSGNLILGIARKPLDYQEKNKGGAIFAKTQPEVLQTYELLRGSEGKLESFCVIENEKFNIHDLQLLPDNKLLLVCGRSRYRGKNDFDKNGRIYSNAGQYFDEILLGDGIQNTHATSDGVIWTSFFDEGVFGNFGWKNPVGSSGLVAWNIAGEKLYEYEPINSLDHICDCYALNVVSDSETWCYYYTEFPLVRIDKFKIKAYWEVPISGSGSFALQGDYVLFRGGYEKKNLLYLVKLGADHLAKSISEIELTDGKNNLLKDAWTVARKDNLYILGRNAIYTVSVGDVLNII